MLKQILFAISVLVTLGCFSWTAWRIYTYFRLTKPYPIGDFGKRFWLMMKVAIGQTKIFRHPVMGLLHALVFWGFLVILVGSIEMIIDGFAGTERVLSVLGPVYDVLMASGDVFAFIIALSILVFLCRRLCLKVARFYGPEMKKVSKLDANIALTIIFVLML